MKVVNTGKLYRIYSDDLQVHNQLPADVYIVRFNKMQGFYLETYCNMEVNEEKIYGVHMAKINKVMKNKKELIKGNQALKKEEIDLLREKFIGEYSKEKGWDPNELSTSILTIA